MSEEENLNQTFLERFDHKETEYWNQPVEVTKRQYEKTIVVTEWVPIEEKNDERPNQN